MFNVLELFFSPNSGLDVKRGVIDGREHNGYINGLAAEFHMDNSGPAVERYTFEIMEFTGWRSVIGKTIVIDDSNYLIESIENDGTGVITLALYAQ